MKKISIILKIALLTILTCFCAVKLWQISGIYVKESELKTEMLEHVQQQIVQDIPVLETVPSANYTEGEIEMELPDAATEDIVAAPVINPFVTELQENLNNDIIGWLCIPGTNIDYPIVSADDNDYYLHRDIYKNEAKAGTLFTDYRCAPDVAGFNTVIYGHNMKNRSMFGDLRLYANPEFMEENRQGILYTPTKTYLTEIFAYMVIASDDEQIYANPESADDFFEYIRENARVCRELEGIDKVLTLSTCAYEFEDARIVVLASVSNLYAASLKYRD